MNRSRSDRGREQEVVIPVGASRIPGILGVPSRSKGLVVFAHGSGSGRLSPRNNYVASVLQEGGLSTLLVDLLEEAESLDRRKVFDIDLLADRLLAIARWSSSQRETRDLMLGYFGASTGAAAAIQAAALRKDVVHAVVSRGGRPDLAQAALRHITAPVLLIVGGEDDEVLDLNISALNEIQAAKQLEVVPGATHLFEEPGTLDEAARLAALWFNYYLT